MRKIIISVFLVLNLSVGVSQSKPLDLSVGYHAGLAGNGVDITYGLNKQFSVRGGINSSSIVADTSSDGVTYDLELEFDSKYAIIDWHMFSGSFRVSAGIFSNASSFSGSATSDASNFLETLPANSGDVSVTATISFPSSAPYAGVGWSSANTKKGGLVYSVDLGVLFQGVPTVSLTEAEDPLNLIQDSDLADDISELEVGLDSFQFYPIAMARIGYKF